MSFNMSITLKSKQTVQDEFHFTISLLRILNNWKVVMLKSDPKRLVLRFLHQLLILCYFFAVSTGKANNDRIDSLSKLLSKSTDPQTEIKILLQLSDESLSDNPLQAMQYNQKIIEIATKSGKDKDAINSLLNLVEICYTRSDLKNAMEYAFKARELAERKDMKKELAIVLDHMGMIYYDIGDREKCSHLYFESLKLYEQIKQKEGMCKTLAWIGLLYFDQLNYEKAWEYYTKSLELAKEIKSPEGIASNLNNLSKVLSARKQYGESLKYLNESLTIHLKLDNPSFVASNYLNIGATYFSMNEYSKALKYYYKALEIFTDVSNKVRIALTRIKLGETYLKIDDMPESIQNAKIALELGRENGYKEVIYQSSKLMHDIYILKHDTASAYRYSIIENQWKDSLAVNEKIKSLASLDLQYQFDKKEQEQKIAREKKNVLITGTFIFMALAIIIILLILNQLRLKARKSRLEKKNLEQELDFKKKELIINVMSLMKQNEKFTNISRKILQFEDKVQSKEALDILKLIGSEISRSNEKESLKEFSLRFKEIHKDFYNTLLTKYPGLTPNELRLCAFLKMNMTTKEISELTGQQLKTLEHARYILRIKLGISNSEVNLITFLAQL